MLINTITDAIHIVLRFFAIPWITPAIATIVRIIANAIFYHSLISKSLFSKSKNPGNYIRPAEPDSASVVIPNSNNL